MMPAHRRTTTRGTRQGAVCTVPPSVTRTHETRHPPRRRPRGALESTACTSRLCSGNGSRELPATVGEGPLNLFQIVIGQHFAGKRDPDRQDASFDRLPGEDLTLLVKT